MASDAPDADGRPEPGSSEPGGSEPARPAPFAPPPVDPRGEYVVSPPEQVVNPSRVNLGDTGRAGLPYEPFSNTPPPADPRDRQFSLLQILGLMAAAAVTWGVVRRFVTVNGPSTAAAVTGLTLLIALGVQAVFRPPWALFNLTIWLLLGAYVVTIGLALCWP